MDLIFREYHDPFVLLDTMISSGRFCDFIDTFQKKRDEKMRWELYLHRFQWSDMTFEEFNRRISSNQIVKPQEKPSNEQLETITKTSFDILNGFQIERM